jgi:hypothetical protein
MATLSPQVDPPGPAILRLEALKLLKDWSVWMVTVETAAIGWLLGKVDGIQPDFKKFTIIAFALSIAFAAWVLSGIVSLVQRVNTEPALDKAGVYDLRGVRKIRFGWITFLQHLFFFAGVVLFILSLLCR